MKNGKNFLRTSRRDFLTFGGMLAVMASSNSILLADREVKESKETKPEVFKFAFLTDVHLSRNLVNRADDGLRKALRHAKDQGAEFVLFGGDSAHADQGTDEEVEQVWKRFISIVKESGLRAYHTIGNHDGRVYWDEDPKKACYDREYEIFEKYCGPTYYSFDYKGIHFVVLNSLYHNSGKGWYGIGPEQLKWLKADLDKTGELKPVIASLHVPILSLYWQVTEGTNKNVDIIANYKEVMDLFDQYNVKIVLQGHQHIHEEIMEKKRHDLTGGAVSANWWNGEYFGTEEGYLLLEADARGKISWEYVDYGWDGKNHCSAE